jgi:hypothetical protein
MSISFRLVSFYVVISVCTALHAPPSLQFFTNMLRYPNGPVPVSWGAHGFTMCTIPKNGSSRWRALILGLLGDAEPKHMHLPKYPDLNSSWYGRLFFVQHDSYMIVRNPYVRFFSYYYDKHVKSADGKPVPSISKVIQSLNATTCDEHYCPQTSLCSYKQLNYKHVLKVEQMSIWYPSFVKKYDLYAMVEHGWNNLGGHSSVEECFYHPQTLSCKTYRKLGYPITRNFEVCNFTTPKAFRCSLSHMEDLNQNDVDILTTFYMKDLIALNYPTWNGKAKDFVSVLH